MLLLNNLHARASSAERRQRQKRAKEVAKRISEIDMSYNS